MGEYTNIPIAGGDTATPLSLKKRLRFIQKYFPAQKIRFLDCGCGAGEYVRPLRYDLGIDAVGIEYLADKVAVAQQDPALKDFVQQGDIESLPFESSSFDMALLNEVLEHVPNEARGLQEIHRVLKPGGILIIFSPNRWYPFETHGVYLKGTKKRVPHYMPLIPYIPLGIGQRFFDYWARNYWPGQLRRLVEQNGFQIIATDYLWQTFENISGRQPALLRVARPILRGIANTLEKTPVLRRFGVSQVLVVRKVEKAQQPAPAPA
jgi:SAM-dependent methyltransferase